MSDRADALRGLPQSSTEDLLLLLCEQKLGEGVGRQAFVYRLDDSMVIKYAHGSGFQNVIEYEIWQLVKDDKQLAKWFAPVVMISGLGNWLLQKRTHPVTAAELPKRVPTIFTDLKADNWGRLDGRFVCHDYGSVLCRMIGSQTHRLRRADWD